MGKIPILTNIFQMGWNHQLDMFLSWVLFPPSKRFEVAWNKAGALNPLLFPGRGGVG